MAISTKQISECEDCKQGHCHSCHREIAGVEHHESDGVHCEPCATFRARISSLEAEREMLRKCIVDFVDNCLRDEKECPYCREAAALVRGEVKNG